MKNQKKRSRKWTILVVILAAAAAAAAVFALRTMKQAALQEAAGKAAGKAVTAGASTIQIPDPPRDLSKLPAGTAVTEEEVGSDPGRWFTIAEIQEGDAVYQRILGKSYRQNPNVALSDLRYLKMLYCDFDGNSRVGEMIVNKGIASDIREIFLQLYRDRYQIRGMKLIDDYWETDGTKSDWNSVHNDNTSAFCYRTVAHTSALSRHARGLAIDLNPYENPEIRRSGSTWIALDHPEMNAYAVNRTARRAHVITTSDEAYRLFTAHGFRWGGTWANPDYQHFEKR